MSDCTHDCSSCGESCGERTAPQDFRAPANGLSHIGKVIAVVSGKGGVDYLFVDMPPGTGDVPLTVFQSLPVDGIVVVTTPQDLVSMIVTKAVKMAEMMHIPVLGLVENYSYFRCPDCGKEHAIFGESHIERVAADLGLKVLARLPIDPAVAAACDAGRIEELDPNYLTAVAELLAE